MIITDTTIAVVVIAAVMLATWLTREVEDDFNYTRIITFVLALLAICATGAALYLTFGRLVAPTEVPKVSYYKCNKDQVSENIHNQPNGIIKAVAEHCELHTVERKM